MIGDGITARPSLNSAIATSLRPADHGCGRLVERQNISGKIVRLNSAYNIHRAGGSPPGGLRSRPKCPKLARRPIWTALKCWHGNDQGRAVLGLGSSFSGGPHLRNPPQLFRPSTTHHRLFAFSGRILATRDDAQSAPVVIGAIGVDALNARCFASGYRHSNTGTTLYL